MFSYDIRIKSLYPAVRKKPVAVRLRYKGKSKTLGVLILRGFCCRSGGIRTRGLLVPNQTRYQTALHLEAGADEGTRTPDLLITNRLLYQLSHIGTTSDGYYIKAFPVCPALISAHPVRGKVCPSGPFAYSSSRSRYCIIMNPLWPSTSTAAQVSYRLLTTSLRTSTICPLRSSRIR